MHILICPVCEASLKKSENSFVCINNHNFDLSSNGYLNLMLVSHKSSNTPGETKQMIQSRRMFLDAGYYSDLPAKITELIEQNYPVQNSSSLKILDVGCGEGYYLNKISQALSVSCISYGTDITKHAIKLASKKYQDSLFIISNTHYKLPFNSASLDIILNIFAPRNITEFYRVLKPGGLIIVVFPGAQHLRYLRDFFKYKISYSEKGAEIIDSFNKSFKVIVSSNLTKTTRIKKSDQQLLAQMTPIYWKIKQDLINELPDCIEENFDFNILVFKK